MSDTSKADKIMQEGNREKTELVRIGGLDLTKILNSEVFMNEQDPEVIYNSINPLVHGTSYALYWTGAFLNKLKEISYHLEVGYDKSKGAFYDFCREKFKLSRTTVNRYTQTYQVLNMRGITVEDIQCIGIDSLCLIAKSADHFGDEALRSLLEFAAESSEDELKEYIDKVTGKTKNSTTATHEEFSLAYFEEDLKTFKGIHLKLEEYFKSTDLSKVILLALIEYSTQNLNYVTDLKNEIEVLIHKHKIEHPTQLANIISEVFEDKNAK